MATRLICCSGSYNRQQTSEARKRSHEYGDTQTLRRKAKERSRPFADAFLKRPGCSGSGLSSRNCQSAVFVSERTARAVRWPEDGPVALCPGLFFLTSCAARIILMLPCQCVAALIAAFSVAHRFGGGLFYFLNQSQKDAHPHSCVSCGDGRFVI